MSENLPSSSHPPLPPTSEENQVSWLRLLRSRRVGVATFYRLMAEHDWDAEAAVRSLPGIARDAGVSGYAACSRDAAKAEYRAARTYGARMVARGMPEYPDDLAQLDDAPPFFWAVGDIAVLQRPMIALVGARNASSLGLRMTRKLAEGLAAEGFVVVSGLARGVDAVAHKAALGSGTVAVQAGGVDVLYPTENADFAREIPQSGLRISEQAMGLQPQARHFPTRNRIVSGLAQGVVVVEAAAKSGSLITARVAADQGREVFAVPGHPFDARATGSNFLIRDGATLVRDVDDILSALPEPAPAAEIPANAPPTTRTLTETATLHADILSRLGPSPLAEDQLIRDIANDPDKASPDRISAEVTELELSGRLERQAGGLLALAGDALPPRRH